MQQHTDTNVTVVLIFTVLLVAASSAASASVKVCRNMNTNRTEWAVGHIWFLPEGCSMDTIADADVDADAVVEGSVEVDTGEDAIMIETLNSSTSTVDMDQHTVSLIQSALEANNPKYKLRLYKTGRSDAWKIFREVWETDSNGVTKKLSGLCACSRCCKVYRYRDEAGTSYGTKNLTDHVRVCVPRVIAKQTTLEQVISRVPHLSGIEKAELRNAEVWYCASNYHAFRAVESEGLLNLLQVVANLAAKHGKFDVKSVIYGRKTVSADAASLAKSVNADVAAALKEPLENGTVSICTDMYTDDYQKRSYLDVHAFAVDRNFELKHFVLAVRHFGVAAHTAENVYAALADICSEWRIPIDETPATTDHGSNIVASLKGRVRLDCLAHRLNTVLDTSWTQTKESSSECKEYDEAAAALSAHVKRTVGIQEQLPCSIKSGGDTRPWLALYNRAASIEKSYDKLLELLASRDHIRIVARVDPAFNKELRLLLETTKGVFEKLQYATKPTLQYVVPSYYLVMKKLAADSRDSSAIRTLKSNLRDNMDKKFYTSIKAYHWMACFLDPFFRDFSFVPTVSSRDRDFKRDLLEDLESWLMLEMSEIARRIRRDSPLVEQPQLPPPPKRTVTDIFSELRASPTDEVVSQRILPTNAEMRAEIDLYRNFAAPLKHDPEDPLQFWRDNATSFPTLAQLSRHVLSICASSAQSERDFSSVGLTISQLRTRLSPRTVEALEILRSAGKFNLLAHQKRVEESGK